MMTGTASNHHAQMSQDIAAYLDGELTPAALALFEGHLKACSRCARNVSAQRRLLCALDCALKDEPALALPANFAEIVAAHAQSDMRGVRGRAEHGRALRVSLLLLAAAFALLGGATLIESVLAPITSVLRYAASIFGFIWHALYNFGDGVAVILRAVGCRFVFESQPSSIFAFVLLASALALLPHLINSYHRAPRITEYTE